MSQKFKVHVNQNPHFVTFTVHDWIDVFTRPCYRNIFVDSLNFCIANKGLHVHAWVLMTNHAHLLISSQTKSLPDLVRDIKRFTSRATIKALAENPQESRNWILRFLRIAGKNNAMNDQYQFWQNGYHPINCWNQELIKQKIEYIHQNPVRAGHVSKDYEWQYSRAGHYATGIGLVNIDKLEFWY